MDKSDVLLEITPVDREVFLLVSGAVTGDPTDKWVSAMVRKGVDDHQPAMQAIARHRLAAAHPSADIAQILQPFANYAASVLSTFSKGQPDSQKYQQHNHAVLTLGDLRRARDWLWLGRDGE